MEPHAQTPRALVDVEYAPKDAFEFADTIFQLAKRGFVNATSAGFRVLEIAQLTDKQRQRWALVFTASSRSSSSSTRSATSRCLRTRTR